jgi:hypothetical protein
MTTAPTTRQQLASLLASANGRRRVRLLDLDDLDQVIAEARRDGAGCVAGATVANAYKYPAVRTAALAARRSDGSVLVRVGVAPAHKGSAPRPRSLVEDIPTVHGPRFLRDAQAWADSVPLDRDLPPSTVLIPARVAARWAAERRRHALATALARLDPADRALYLAPPDVGVSAADSTDAGNCPTVTAQVAAWWPGRTSVPASTLLAVMTARAPELLRYALRAVRQAAHRQAVA